MVEHEPLIRLLQQVQMIVGRFSELVKAKGISGYTQLGWQENPRALEAYWQEQGWAVSERLACFLLGLDAYLLQSQESVRGPSQILCCSDVLESMFGKYKYGLSKQVISDESVKIAAFGRGIGLGEVRDAMGCITHQFLRDAEARQPPSLMRLRRDALPKTNLKTYPT